MANAANINSAVGGLINKSTPLISFNAIIDFDMSLIKLILLEYRNSIIFDLDKAKNMTYKEILYELYWRKYTNPLYLLMKDDSKKEFLDKCYEEFKSNEVEVYKHAVSTEIYNLLLEFSNSSDITPSILYYTQPQKDLLDSDENLSKIKSYSLRSARNPKDNTVFGQYFLKDIQEAEPFKELTRRTFYFSTVGSNLNEDNNDIVNDELIMELIKKGNNISIFDLYKSDYIGRSNDDNS